MQRCHLRFRPLSRLGPLATGLSGLAWRSAHKLDHRSDARRVIILPLAVHGGEIKGESAKFDSHSAVGLVVAGQVALLLGDPMPLLGQYCKLGEGRPIKCCLPEVLHYKRVPTANEKESGDVCTLG